MYLLNWIYRYFHEPGYRHWIVWVSGTVQTIFYLDLCARGSAPRAPAC